MRKILIQILLLLSTVAFGQSGYITKDTTILGWNARMTYVVGKTDSTNMFVCLNGAGEVGTDTTKASVYLAHYWLTHGWDGGIVLGNGTHYPVYVTLQPNATYQQAAVLKPKLDAIIARFKVRYGGLNMIGLSNGGWMIEDMLYSKPSTDNFVYGNMIRSAAILAGVLGDDGHGVAPNTYPGYYGYAAKRTNYRVIGFEQINDNRAVGAMLKNMSDSVGSNARFPFFWTNFGAGGHSNFNDMASPYQTNWTLSNTNVQSTNGGSIATNPIATGQNLYQWMLRQDADTAIHVAGALMASPGLAQTIYAPTSTATLTGSATGGTPSYTYSWTQVSGPSTATISAATSASTGLTGLIIGTYIFKFKATDAVSAKDSANVNVYVLNPCNVAAPVTYIIAPTSTNEIYITDASGRGWKGGDTLKISSQYHYTTIEIDNFKGDSCRPIIIIDSGAGFVHTDKMVFGGGAEYYKVLGTGNPLVTYGFKVTGAGTAIRINKSRHYTFSNIEVTNSLGAGVLARYDPNLSDTASLYPNYRMPKCIFTKIYVHSTEGEGFYVGSSDPSGTDPSYTPPGYYPNRLDSVEISNCIVDSTGWDGIQLSCGGNGDVIKNNIITNFGYLDLDAQRAGIILGSACQGDVDSNRISKGTGNAIELYGYGAVRCRWNTIDSTGLTIHHAGGEENIYTADYSVSPETVPHQTILIDHNAINHPPIIGAIKVNNAFGNIDYTTITNNTFCIPSAGGSWQSSYLSYPTPSTVSNNTLNCGTVDCSNCIIGLFRFK